MVKRMASSETTLPIRVSVLEHTVGEVKSGLDSHRGETRTAFNNLQSALERLGADIARRASPTNWYAVIGATASGIGIVAAVFALAEWRVTNANAPLYEAVRDGRAAISRSGDDIVKLRIQQGIMQAEHERVKIEQEARIRSRVDAEQRATERVPQPPTK
jgi:hypothetical protein